RRGGARGVRLGAGRHPRPPALRGAHDRRARAHPPLRSPPLLPGRARRVGRPPRVSRWSISRDGASSVTAAGSRRAIGLALCSAALFGLSTPAAKRLVAVSDPWLLAGFLYLGSGVGLGAYRLLHGLGAVPGPSPARLRSSDWA